MDSNKLRYEKMERNERYKTLFLAFGFSLIALLCLMNLFLAFGFSLIALLCLMN